MEFRHLGFVTTYLPGDIWRGSAFGEISGIDKSFDNKRVELIKKYVAELFDPEEVKNITNMNTCLRPCPPDDIPIIGNLKFFPNIYVNAGHSGRGTSIGIASSKVVSELLMEGNGKSI